MSPALIWIAFVLLLALLVSLAEVFLTLAVVQTVMFLVGIGVFAACIVVFLNRPRK